MLPSNTTPITDPPLLQPHVQGIDSGPAKLGNWLEFLKIPPISCQIHDDLGVPNILPTHPSVSQNVHHFQCQVVFKRVNPSRNWAPIFKMLEKQQFEPRFWSPQAADVLVNEATAVDQFYTNVLEPMNRAFRQTILVRFPPRFQKLFWVGIPAQLSGFSKGRSITRCDHVHQMAYKGDIKSRIDFVGASKLFHHLSHTSVPVFGGQMACFEKWAQENPDTKKIPSEYRPPSMPTIPIEFKSLNVMYERMFLKKSRTTTEEENLASITSQSKMYAADFRTDMMGLSDYMQTYIFKYLDLEAYRDCERTFNSHGGLKTTINAHMYAGIPPRLMLYCVAFNRLKEAGLLKVSSKGDLRITLSPFWFEKEMKEPFWESVPDIAGNTEDDR